MARCSRCRAPLARSDRFCGACGAPTKAMHDAALATHNEGRARSDAAVRAIVILFAGTLLVLLPVAYLFDEPTLGQVGAAVVLDVAVGLVALWCLGRGALGASLPFRARPDDWGLALLGGAVMFAVMFSYSWLLVQLFEGLADGTVEEVELSRAARVALFLQIVIVAPVLEEWLCRGVAWEAVSRITGQGGTILVTAILFGMLHGLNGANVLEIPHRFVAGLILGWLRARSGGLGPSMLTHGINNAVAFALI